MVEDHRAELIACSYQASDAGEAPSASSAWLIVTCSARVWFAIIEMTRSDGVRATSSWRMRASAAA